MSNTNSLFPFNSQIAYYNYPQLEFPWVILYQTVNKNSNQLLERRFSFLKFLDFMNTEIIDKPLFNEDFDRISEFYFYIERYIENINYSSRYTWTIDNSKDDKGEYNDPEWLFNKYQGWERSKITYLHSGQYLPVNIGFIQWGTPSDITINSRVNSINLSNSLDSQYTLKFSINTTVGAIKNSQIPQNNTNTLNSPLLNNETSNLEDLVISTYPIIVKKNKSKISYLIPLGDLAYAIEFKQVFGDVTYFWSDFEGELEIPIVNQKELIKNTHLKITLPNITSLNSTIYDDKEIYPSVGYLDFYLYGYKIHQTINLNTTSIENSTYEVYPPETVIDLTNPWPNYHRVDINIQNYVT